MESYDWWKTPEIGASQDCYVNLLLLGYDVLVASADVCCKCHVVVFLRPGACSARRCYCFYG